MLEHKMNQEIYERCCKSIAGGLLSNFKKEEGSQPVYVKSAKGARLTDFDGNVYVDYALSLGPCVLGHSNENLKRALKEQIDKMYSGELSMIQIEAAEKIKQVIPSAELIRFAVSGTEAVYNAIRVARGYTGKNMYVKFFGQYHGGVDYILGGIVNNPDNPVVSHGEDPTDLYTTVCTTQGRAEHALDDCYMIDWNDLGALEKLFAAKADEIACVVMEPVTLNVNGCMPEPGYLEGVRELCTKYNVVLIFDETLTGFRIGLNGAQGYFGVTPDMSTFAKAIGGGFPVSVYCGKKEIMDVITKTDVLAVGTYNGNPISAAAILATISELEKDDQAALKHMNRLGTMLKEGFEAAAKKYGIPMIVQGFPSAIYPIFTSKDKIINHRDGCQNSDGMLGAMFSVFMKERGVLNNYRFCTSAAHTEEDVAFAIDAADDALGLLADLFAE
jgi:glutamate-1-semialdehyde 2,1-aminomutase